VQAYFYNYSVTLLTVNLNYILFILYCNISLINFRQVGTNYHTLHVTSNNATSWDSVSALTEAYCYVHSTAGNSGSFAYSKCGGSLQADHHSITKLVVGS
jgi:hypothetical protein